MGALSTGGFQLALAKRSEHQAARVAHRLITAELLAITGLIDDALDPEADWPTDSERELIHACPAWTTHQDALARLGARSVASSRGRLLERASRGYRTSQTKPGACAGSSFAPVSAFAIRDASDPL